jgi:Tfp pilus assembly protein PilV
MSQITRWTRKLQRGDTIVEVLICVLIVSMVLGGAYVTVHRSSQGIRNSQEHAEALKLVQSQLEQLRTNAASTSPTVFVAGTPFCMVDGAATTDTARCAQNAAGDATTTEPVYHLAVTRTSSAGGSLFKVEATWNTVTSQQARETIFYRLYQ